MILPVKLDVNQNRENLFGVTILNKFKYTLYFTRQEERAHKAIIVCDDPF